VKSGHVFDSVPPESRNKEAFSTAIGLFLQRNIHRKSHVEFIYAAMKCMKEFGVHKDLDTYKKLLDVFPKGKFIPENPVQTEFMHYPKQQQCCIDLLDEMEWNNVYPDKELYMQVRNVFGEWTHAMRKMKRMMYWMPKFKNVNPWPAPRPLPDSATELAQLAMKKMCRDPATRIDVWLTRGETGEPEARGEGEDTWIVSGQSPEQAELISAHPEKEALFVDGPFRVWVGERQVAYFGLVADPAPLMRHGDVVDESEVEKESEMLWENWETSLNREFPAWRKKLISAPSIHQQPDGTVLGLCATGTQSKESLVTWVSLLERRSPALAKIPVLFRLRHAGKEVARVGEQPGSQLQESRET
jgi:evolutionarily conserved signaling intermediate in Toll pathway